MNDFGNMAPNNSPKVDDNESPHRRRKVLLAAAAAGLLAVGAYLGSGHPSQRLEGQTQSTAVHYAKAAISVFSRSKNKGKSVHFIDEGDAVEAYYVISGGDGSSGRGSHEFDLVAPKGAYGKPNINRLSSVDFLVADPNGNTFDILMTSSRVNPWTGAKIGGWAISGNFGTSTLFNLTTTAPHSGDEQPLTRQELPLVGSDVQAILDGVNSDGAIAHLPSPAV